MYPQHLETLVREYRLSADDHDPWGTAMGWRFAICDFLTWHDDSIGVPDDWQFRPGIGPADESYELQTIRYLVASGDATPEGVLELGEILRDVTEYCESAGLSY